MQRPSAVNMRRIRGVFPIQSDKAVPTGQFLVVSYTGLDIHTVTPNQSSSPAMFRGSCRLGEGWHCASDRTAAPLYGAVR
jgi:hypothetical protein